MVQNSVSVKGLLAVKLYAESKLEFNKVSMGLSCSSNSSKSNKPNKEDRYSLPTFSYLGVIKNYKV